ncbi:hypothetical protein D3C71_485440 [compost metagenome]
MKTYCLFILLFAPAFIFSQVTNHFDQPDARWYVAKTYAAGTLQNPSFGATKTTVYGYLGDSLISSTFWHKLYSTDDPLFSSDFVFEGLIRTDNSLILFTDALSQLDTLYNFNIAAGDYIPYSFYGNLYPTRLDDVYTITLNGEPFRIYDFDEPMALPNFFDYVNERWIEGIGSIHGPLFPHQPRTFTHEILAGDSLILTCSFADGQSFWQHPSYDNCYTQIMLGTGDHFLTEADLYPNPFQNQLTVQLPENRTFEMSLFSETGQVLFLKTVVSGEIVDLSSLSAGIYFVKLSDGTQTLTDKLVKQQ